MTSLCDVDTLFDLHQSMMRQTPPKSSPSLGIRLESEMYAPGDTITGHIYRKTRVVSPDAVLVCCMHGRAQILSGRDAKYPSTFTLLSCHQKPDIIHQGPLHIGNNSEEHRWPFRIQIPIYADATGSCDNTAPCYTTLGVTDHQLPPTYVLREACMVGAFVEYFVSAKLQVTSNGETKTWNAVQPVKLVQYTSNPPIADFAVKRYRYLKSVLSHRLVPGMQDVGLSLSQKFKKSFNRLEGPEFKFDLLFELPTIIQLDNPTPIPLRLLISPNWAETSEIIKEVPQKVRLISVKMQLITQTTVICPGMAKREQRANLDLGISEAMEKLAREICIPCTTSWEPIDLGEMINFRIGLQKTGFPSISQTWEKRAFMPSFRTYNMAVTHELKWMVHAKVAGESVHAQGISDVQLLKPSDEREQAGRGREVSPAHECLETGSESTRTEADEAWIRPPTEEGTPPIFTDAAVKK